MKTLLAAVVTFLIASAPLTSSYAQTADAKPATATYKLTVVITDISHRSGTFRIGIANSEETFTGESFKTKRVETPTAGGLTVTFEDLPAGRYAVRLMQDLNGNDKMDYDGQMPTEPFGFSNVTMLMGPPSFGQSAFDLNGDKTIEVGLMEL